MRFLLPSDTGSDGPTADHALHVLNVLVIPVQVQVPGYRQLKAAVDVFPQ